MTQPFPTLAGQDISITRTSEFKTRKPVAISGKETAIADWKYPRYTWELKVNLLRQGFFLGATWLEFQELMGFYNARNGGFDTFLYQDPDDYQVNGQGIGIGDGTPRFFQLVKSFGGFVEPLLAVTAVDIYFNGTAISTGGTNYGGTNYEWAWMGYDGLQYPGGGVLPIGWSSTPGQIWFSPSVPAGVVITADLTYSYPCRFVEDQCQFERFTQGVYAVKKLTFMSVK